MPAPKPNPKPLTIAWHTDDLSRNARSQPLNFNLPPITLGLIVACVAVFFGQQRYDDTILTQFALWPFGENFHIWQLVSYFFLHGGIQHLMFNMLGLAMFGSDLERLWGQQRYIALIAVSTITAALMQQALTYSSGDIFPTVGASGGIYGLLLAFALTFPNRIVTPLFPPIPMRARTFAMVFGGIELFSGVTGTISGVAHFAHLGGMLGALLLMGLWRLEANDARR
jgi:membrane associated rhomboid family serine protease